MNTDSLLSVYKKNPKNAEVLSQLAQSYEFVQPDTAVYYAKKLLNLSNEPEYIARGYNTFANCALVNNNIDSAIFYYKKAVDVSVENHMEYNTAFYQHNLAQAYLNLGEADKAIPLYKDALNYFINHKDAKNVDFNLNSIYGGLGDCQNLIGFYDKALESQINALRYAKKINDPVSIGINLNSIASIYTNLENYKKALEYNLLALHEFKKTNYPLGEATVLLNLAESYFYLSDFEKTLQYLKESEQILNEQQTTYNLGEVYTLYGKVYLVKNDLDESLKYFEKSLKLHQQSGAKMYEGNTLLQMAKVFAEKNNIQQARIYGVKALHIFDAEKIIKGKKEALELLLSISLSDEQAKSYYHQYLQANDAYLNGEKQKAISNHEIKYETALKEARIVEQELENQKQKLYKYSAFGGIAVLLLLGGGGYAYNQERQKKKIIQKQKELQQLQYNMTKLGLSNLNNQINTHDIKNTLTAALNEVQIKAPKSYQHISNLLSITESALYSDSFTDSLRNQFSQIEGLVELSKPQLFEDVELKIENTLQPDTQIPRLLLKNLVENSLKHGIKGTNQKGEIEVKTYQNNDNIHIEVRDSGRGINHTKVIKGKGISVYQELFEYFNQKNDRLAQMELKKVKDGTLASIQIPANYQYT